MLSYFGEGLTGTVLKRKGELDPCSQNAKLATLQLGG